MTTGDGTGPAAARGGSRAVAAAGAAGIPVVAGLLAAGPLVLALLGGVELVALTGGRWDATWNDGDLGIALAGLVALLVLLGAAWLGGTALGRAARLRLLGWAVAAGALGVAAAVIAAVGLLRS
jgi:hypothetical protein